MAGLDERLLNEFQRDFPLTPRPYAAVAGQLGTREDTVIDTLRRLVTDGAVSRVGATFAAGRIGAATLAALVVPPDDLARVAYMVNAYPEVNHNYEREHRFNLWFVITGPDEARIGQVVRDIERATACGPALSLPMVEPYHIDLGFDVSADGAAREAQRCVPDRARPQPAALAPGERALVSALQDGLPLVAAPYAALAGRAGTSEAAVIATLARWLESGIVNRLGVIVRHHELGYRDNAMAVWDVPDDKVRTIGMRVAAAPFVTLCYCRLRQPPHWGYNLYCMIHGKSRERVLAQIAALGEENGLAGYPSAALFSRRRFKQRGARYLQPAPAMAAHG